MSRLKSVWRLLNLPCEGMTLLASESLDRDLDRLEQLALRLHLCYCAGCRRYLQQIQLLRTALRRLASGLEGDESFPFPLPGPALPDEVSARIKRALKAMEPPAS